MLNLFNTALVRRNAASLALALFPTTDFPAKDAISAHAGESPPGASP